MIYSLIISNNFKNVNNLCCYPMLRKHIYTYFECITKYIYTLMKRQKNEKQNKKIENKKKKKQKNLENNNKIKMKKMIEEKMFIIKVKYSTLLYYDNNL